MLAYTIRRLLLMIPTFFGITIILFFMLQLAPGDPATMRFGASLGGDASASDAGGGNRDAAIKKFREKYNLDKPKHEQYVLWLADLVRFDFGEEMQRPNVRVGEEMWKKASTITIPLALVSVFLMYLISIPLGIYSAARQGTKMDKATTFLVFLLYSMPSFWVGLMLVLIFGPTGFDVLPTMGMHDLDADRLSGWDWWKDTLLHAVLPVVTMTYANFAYLSRQMRVGMLDVISQDYVRTARAKGLSEKKVILKHAARNALIPVVTLFATILPFLVGGSVIVESVFNLPGIGSYMLNSLMVRDYNVIMAVSTVIAIMTMFGFLLSDLMYAVVDPRISYD